ncbi:hypothetical protein EHQ58_11545 [Leptospira ognonensis]|uniref:Uncharacterized protein n=1 Tax=Leptospira ognonensis TaxID=2484945 RepID=A0A4V3JR04_9LEPT|nr:hypothetical protein [Leptospira ognonensis]TGL58023.1 hypothetical protein EHQ58_11545 [Leptospira ognonensis]
MEKFRIGVFLFLLLVVAVLTFSLTKSWRLYDSGYEVTVETPEELKEKEKDNILDPNADLDLEDGTGKVLWKQYFIYPVGLVTEAGGVGPDGITSHARNLFSVNLKSGTVKKLFLRDIYIWDFFSGEFTKKIISNNIDEPKEDTLSIEKKLIIIAANLDSNKDGVLNHKDAKRIFIYDPDRELLEDVMPEGYQFKKLILNTQKNNLALVVKKIPMNTSLELEKKKETPAATVIKQEIFSYDVNTNKGVLTGALD